MAIFGDKNYYPIVAKPGVKRDGTVIDDSYSTDAQWARIQRGKWRKMGGYRSIATNADYPIRGLFVHTQDNIARVYLGSNSSLQYSDLAPNGIGGGFGDRTPSGFVPDDRNIWQMDGFPEASTNGIALIAHAAPNMLAIDSSEARKTWYGNAVGTAALLNTTAPEVSGGACVSPPYVFVYGSDGYIAWCEPNQPTHWNPGTYAEAGEARVARQKIVRGIAARNGRSGPGAIFWSLDAVIVAEFIGGEAIFAFQTASGQSSILSSSGVIEYDSIYYWAGVDRFLVFNGVVTELPNNVSINWFYDNLNWEYRNKVWATKVPRYGEIWWHFPFGDSTECNAAIIYNIRENCWYDTRIARTSGYFAQVFRYPVWAANEQSTTPVRRLNGTPAASSGNAALAFDGDFATADTQTAPNGTISYDYGLNATKSIRQIRVRTFVNGTYQLALEYSDDILNWTTIQSTGAQSYTTTTDVVFELPDVGAHRAWRIREYGGNTLNIAELYFMGLGGIVYQHEFGVDHIVGQNVYAVPSYFETPNIDFTRSGPLQSGWTGTEANVQLCRIEPDFLQSGSMRLGITGQAYPNAPIKTFNNGDANSLVFTDETEKIDIKFDTRLLRLRFESNVVGGDYQQGEILLELEQTDGRP